MTVSRLHQLLHAYRQEPAAWQGANVVVENMVTAPKFVFTEEVLRFISDHRADYNASLSAAIRAGHCELPHSPMLIEYANQYPGTSNRFFWLIEDASKGHRGFAMWCAILGRINGRHKAVIDPGVGIDLRVDASLESFDYWGPKSEHLRDQAYSAIFMAMALHVRGIVTRPPNPVNERLDRARIKRGLPPVTKDFVTVHIGYVTDRNGKRHAYTEGVGHHVRIHLRRGHIRNQACGPGLQDHHEVWISPVLVNYVPGGPSPQPDYLVVP